MAAVKLDEANSDKEIGPSQTEVAQGIPSREVAEICREEDYESLERALHDGPRLRRGGDIAGSNLGEQLFPNSCPLRFGLRHPLSLLIAAWVGFIILVGDETDSVRDDVGDGVSEAEADAGLDEVGGKRRDVLQRQRLERLLVVPVDDIQNPPPPAGHDGLGLGCGVFFFLFFGWSKSFGCGFEPRIGRGGE